MQKRTIQCLNHNSTQEKEDGNDKDRGHDEGNDEYGDVLIAEHQDTSGLSSVADLIKQSKANFDDRQKRLIDEVAKNPDYVKPNGKLNITKLSENLGCCVATTKRTITQIKSKFNLDL